jgi:hypothetical protein
MEKLSIEDITSLMGDYCLSKEIIEIFKSNLKLIVIIYLS